MPNALFTAAGTLRAPWRLLLFVGALVASTLAVGAILGPILTSVYGAIGLRGQTVATIVDTVAALGATWFCLRYIEKKPWSDLGLHAEAARPAKVATGLVVSSGAITLAIVFLIVVGWLRRDATDVTEWAGPTLRMTMLLLPAALGEELIARGYILTAIKDAIGWGWAVAITSVGFGLAHLQNPGANAQSLVLVALAGVFLATVRISTNSLYAAWAAHFAWNWVMAALFHAPVSGLAFEYAGYRYVDAGPDWASGGAWGPESGVPAGVLMVAGIAALNRAALKDLFLRRKSDG